MPELPEVETIRRDLEARIVGKKIRAVRVKKARLVKGGVKQFIDVLRGDKFSDIGRRGKLLIFSLSKARLFLLVHLKMTGQLIYRQGKKIIAGGHSFIGMDWNLPNKHTPVIISFRGGSRPFFYPHRQFGST